MSMSEAHSTLKEDGGHQASQRNVGQTYHHPVQQSMGSAHCFSGKKGRKLSVLCGLQKA